LPNLTEHRADRPAGKRRWSGVPAADRQARRRELLLDAAFELLGTEGWSGTSVRAVCERARLNPRYFYESFADLDALVIAVYDQIVHELSLEVLAALETSPGDPAAQAREAIRRIVAFVDEDRRRARVLYVEALGNEALNRRRLDTGHAIVAFIERYARAHQAGSEGTSARRETAARLGAAVLVGGLSELLIEWLDGQIPLSRDQLVEDATVLFLALGDATARLAGARVLR